MKQNRWYRIFTVVSMALGFFVKIWWYQKRKKSEAQWEVLWKNIALKLKQRAYDLEGLLIKVGQLLSVRADIFPECFIKEIKELVDKVPPSPWEEIKKLIESEWGSSYLERLDRIDDNPIASASIGEVYKGTLKDGTVVAIKVQRPNIQKVIGADFQALAIIMWCAKTFYPLSRKFVDFTKLYREIRQVIERELDFYQEMQTATAFKRQFEEWDFILIPKMFSEHCTSKVLVMEWVEPSPILTSTFEPKELAQNLLRIFIPQWLKEGTFHADPHTGNVLINSAGKIVLLDFGMVGEITKRDSEAIQSLVEGIALRNNKKIVQSFSQLGFLLPSADLEETEKLLEQVMTINLGELKEMDILSLRMKIIKIVRSLPIQIPTRFVFLGRSMVTIQGIIESLCPDENIIELGKPVYYEWLKQNEKSKWKFIPQWFSSLQIVKDIQEISDLLKEPKRNREWKVEEQMRQFNFTRYESAKKYAFMFGLLNCVFIYISLILSSILLFQTSLFLSIAAAIWYAFVSLRQRRWMKKLNKK